MPALLRTFVVPVPPGVEHALADELVGIPCGDSGLLKPRQRLFHTGLKLVPNLAETDIG
jgi:hypothetical protein